MEESSTPPPVLRMSSPSGERIPLLSSNNTLSGDQFVNNNTCASCEDALVPCVVCFSVSERQNMVRLRFGQYAETITAPGCYFRSCLGLEMRPVHTDLQTFHMGNTKIVDSTGSPLVVSGIVTYEVVNARRAVLDVRNTRSFVQDQAPAILKRVVSRFSYAQLRMDSDTVSDVMARELQTKVMVAGIRIHSFRLNELSYAPEIAGAMLKRQQAQALLEARREIVKGAKEIAEEAVGSIADDLPPGEKAKLLTNVLVVLIGEKEVTPTLQV